MRYETLGTLNAKEFKRLTGVCRDTYEKMLSVLEEGIRNFGRPPKLSRADQLLMTLMYWREYRTEFHIAKTYNVSESTVCRTIQKVENVLISSGAFRLPGKKALHDSASLIGVVLLDATEQPIERPKKNSDATTAARRSDTRKRLS